MHTTTYPTIAGTIALLLASPYPAPELDTEISGTTIITSRLSASTMAIPKGYEEELRELTDLLACGETTDSSPEQQFELLTAFGENLLERTYDLPGDLAEILSANLAELF